MKTFFMAFALCIAAAGCGGIQFGEPERHLVDQSKKGAIAAAADVENAVSLLDPSAGMAVAALKGALGKLQTIHANQEQLQAVVKPPGQPEPYSEEKSKEEREKSKEAQSGGFWGWLAAAGTTVAGIAWAFIKRTQFGALAETFVTAGMSLRMKAKQGTLSEADVIGTLANVNAAAPPVVKKAVEETVVRVKKKLNGALSGSPSSPDLHASTKT